MDLHCHLDLYADHAAAFVECDRAQVYTLAVTTTPKAWRHNRDLAAGTRFVRAALGIHPQLVAERAQELALWRELLPETRFVGEVGLDGGPKHFRSFDLQRRVFETVLRDCAAIGGRILTIHSFRAVRATLDLIEANLTSDRGKVVLHWFTGTSAEAKRAVQLGCYFSVNLEMMESTRHRAMIDKLPLSRLLTETDGPFTSRGGTPTRPGDVLGVVTALSEARSLSVGEVSSEVRENLKRLVSDEPRIA